MTPNQNQIDKTDKQAEKTDPLEKHFFLKLMLGSVVVVAVIMGLMWLVVEYLLPLIGAYILTPICFFGFLGSALASGGKVN